MGDASQNSGEYSGNPPSQSATHSFFKQTKKRLRPNQEEPERQTGIIMNIENNIDENTGEVDESTGEVINKTTPTKILTRDPTSKSPTRHNNRTSNVPPAPTEQE